MSEGEQEQGWPHVCYSGLYPGSVYEPGGYICDSCGQDVREMEVVDGKRVGKPPRDPMHLLDFWHHEEHGRTGSVHALNTCTEPRWVELRDAVGRIVRRLEEMKAAESLLRAEIARLKGDS